MRLVIDTFKKSYTAMNSKISGMALRKEAYVLYLCSRDKRLAWPTRMSAYILSMYIFSPFDIIPDFIPFIGQLDDWLILTFLMKKVKRNIPYYILMEKEMMDHLPIMKDSFMNLMFQALAILIWIVFAFVFTAIFFKL